MKRFALKPNLDKDRELTVTKSVAQKLHNLGAHLYMEEEFLASGQLDGVTYLPKDEVYTIVEAVIVFGGDGTLLRAAHDILPLELPLFGINLGNLGFLTEMERGDGNQLIQLLEGGYQIEERMLLEGWLSHSNGDEGPFYSLNDIVISRGAFSRIMSLELWIDGQYADLYQADGLIVSTPTGSTAYSLSAGGPIVEPDMKVIGITPICPHTLRSRPMILSGSRKVEIRICDGMESHRHLAADGQEICKVNGGELLTIRQAKIVTRLIRLSNHNFYDVLHRKLYEN